MCIFLELSQDIVIIQRLLGTTTAGPIAGPVNSCTTLVCRCTVSSQLKNSLQIADRPWISRRTWTEADTDCLVLHQSCILSKHNKPHETLGSFS